MSGARIREVLFLAMAVLAPSAAFAGFLNPGDYDGSGPGGNARATVVGTGDNTLTYTSTIDANFQPIDTVIGLSSSGSPGMTTVTATFRNNTDRPIDALNFETGTGTGANFTSFNDSPTFVRVTDEGPFKVEDIFFVRIIFNSAPGGIPIAPGDSATVSFILGVPNPPTGITEFTFREFTHALAVPEPTTLFPLALGGLPLLAASRRRRAGQDA